MRFDRRPEDLANAQTKAERIRIEWVAKG